MNTIKVVGLDVAFANFGMVRATVCHGTNSSLDGIFVDELKLLTTVGQDKKVVRKSSDDLRRAKELLHPLIRFCNNSTIAFAEVPHGSQSARASWSLGISVGVLAACPVPIIQVSALEVKLATVGKKTASKAEMIAWAVSRHPDAEWLRHGKKLVAANEHLADAVATIYAGMRTDEFKGLLALMAKADNEYSPHPYPALPRHQLKSKPIPQLDTRRIP
jgi:hypothetical protein